MAGRSIVALLEACLLRALLKEPWEDNLPNDREALEEYLLQLDNLLVFRFSEEGVEAYQAGLEPAERFETTEAFRAHLNASVLKHKNWLKERI